jgi:hypothetical protein
MEFIFQIIADLFVSDKDNKLTKIETNTNAIEDLEVENATLASTEELPEVETGNIFTMMEFH